MQDLMEHGAPALGAVEASLTNLVMTLVRLVPMVKAAVPRM